MPGIQGRSTSERLQGENLDERFPFNWVTVLPVGSGRNAIDAISLGVYAVQENQTLDGGSTTTAELSGHQARRGDIVRILSSANGADAFEVSVKSVDGDTINLGTVLSAALQAGDEITILRPISQRMSATGSTLATIDSSPVQFELDGTPTNVAKDTSNPSNTVPLPVEIVAADGTEITLNAGDINIHTSHTGGSFDSMRIGDGTDLLAINGDGEALTNDADANASLLVIASDIDTIKDAQAGVISTAGAAHPSTGYQAMGSDGTNARRLLTDSSGRLQVSVVSPSLPTGAATEAKQDAAIALLTTIDADTGNIAAQLPSSLGQKARAASLSTALSTEDLAVLVAIQTAAELIDDSVGTVASASPTKVVMAGGHDGTNARRLLTDSNGRLSVDVNGSALPSGAATESSLSGVLTGIGAPGDAAVTNPASSASVVAALKGLLSRLADQAAVDLIQVDTSNVSTVTDFTPPTGAKFMVISNNADGTNSDRVRWTENGGTPAFSGSVKGILVGVGGSSALLPAGAIEFIAESGTANVSVAWFG